jgi:hypothetical protein
VKAVESHGDSVKTFFDVVLPSIVELTAQFTTCKGSQIVRSIDEKLCVGDIVFLSESMQERRRGISPAALTRRSMSRSHTRTPRVLGTAEHVDFKQ